MVGSAAVPVLINCPKYKEFSTFASLFVVVLISLESVFYYREQWKNYRATEQLLVKEYFSFASGKGLYNNMSDEDAFFKFFERVEEAIASENVSTLEVKISERKVQLPPVTPPPERKTDC